MGNSGGGERKPPILMPRWLVDQKREDERAEARARDVRPVYRISPYNRVIWTLDDLVKKNSWNSSAVCIACSNLIYKLGGMDAAVKFFVGAFAHNANGSQLVWWACMVLLQFDETSYSVKFGLMVLDHLFTDYFFLVQPFLQGMIRKNEQFVVFILEKLTDRYNNNTALRILMQLAVREATAGHDVAPAVSQKEAGSEQYTASVAPQKNAASAPQLPEVGIIQELSARVAAFFEAPISRSSEVPELVSRVREQFDRYTLMDVLEAGLRLDNCGLRRKVSFVVAVLCLDTQNESNREAISLCARLKKENSDLIRDVGIFVNKARVRG